MAVGDALLRVEDLRISFSMYDASAPFFSAGRVEKTVVDGLSLSVRAGEVVALVGASGSGKSLLADAILGLYEPNIEVTGSIWFDGEPMDAAALARVHGRGVSLVPQSVAYLDPLMKVGRQVRGFARPDDEGRRRRQRELFDAYGLAPEVADMYPYELSGGMARRVLLMCALMDDPKLIVADEPTPGLDLDLAERALGDLRTFADKGGGVLLVTHDIELAVRVADRVAVFRDGRVVEEAQARAFSDPALLESPYSRALWHAMPEHGFEVPKEGDAL